jgi:hypothetical protein
VAQIKFPIKFPKVVDHWAGNHQSETPWKWLGSVSALAAAPYANDSPTVYFIHSSGSLFNSILLLFLHHFAELSAPVPLVEREAKRFNLFVVRKRT